MAGSCCSVLTLGVGRISSISLSSKLLFLLLTAGMLLEMRARLGGGGVEARGGSRDLALAGGGEDGLEFDWVRPLTLSSSATDRKELRSSWATFTSP